MELATRLTTLGRALPVVLALAALLAVGVLLGSTYFGRGSSPYDSCTTPSGRAVSCALLEKTRRP
jgi:hypothetical protein